MGWDLPVESLSKWWALMSKTVRARAVEIIFALQNQRSNLDGLLAKHGKQVSDQDRKFLQSLCYGITRQWYHLSAIEAQLIDKPLKPRDLILGAIVRCGIYELGWMRSKEHAVVTEYVDATVVEGRPWARGLVNAVLRNFIRHRAELKMERHQAETLWNHPSWLIERIQSAWPERWEGILVENNAPPPMTLRVNQRLVSRETQIEKLRAQDIDCVPGSAPASIRLNEPSPVERLDGFNQGFLSVQDESSQWASIALAGISGERILDACAAPGGKTTHLLELADLDLLALDISERRLTKITENLVRLGLRAQLKAADASQPDTWWDGIPFDGILLDAPCSATGVIRRHPDIRLMRSEAAIKSLLGMQRALIDALWEVLKDGGRLLYTTCSILPSENDEQIERFLGHHPDASLGVLNAGIPGIRTTHGIQQLPSHTGGDGFYYALLVKSGSSQPKVRA